jgi:hypothetical protein
MSEENKKPSLIDDALAEIGRIAFQDPAICTGWVLVSEWMGEGETESIGRSHLPTMQTLIGDTKV